MTMTFGEKVRLFNSRIEFKRDLPEGIRIMNPFKDNPDALFISEQFYSKFFNDTNKRSIVLGINPGRFGAGTTGIPFTDTIRLNEKCGIPVHHIRTYEPSSAFIYEMIDAYGGTGKFYSRFFISAICPLGFTMDNNKGKVVNYNYYDSKELTNAVYNFILTSLQQQLEFGIDTDICFCLGTGKNDSFLRKLNQEHGFFKSIVTLEHPRYIMQYKSKSRNEFIKKYINAFRM